MTLGKPAQVALSPVNKRENVAYAHRRRVAQALHPRPALPLEQDLRVMAKNTGKSYEILTQSIFEEILNYQEVNTKAVNTIKVEHDITIQGRSTTHQIDVSWEFEVGGIKYRTLVQCKDRETLVKKGELLTFKAVLDDIPGQPRGVFVTRTGYQSGASEVAKSNGILLYELREPTVQDFGGIHTVQMNLTILEPQVVGLKVDVDQKWAAEEKQRRGIPASEVIKTTMKIRRFEDELGHTRVTLNELVTSLAEGVQEGPPQTCRHEFTSPTYIRTGSQAFPMMKINAIEFTIVLEESADVSHILLKDLVGVILCDVLGGKTTSFDHALKKV